MLPPWFEVARLQEGVRELVRGQPNPQIAEYFQATGFKGGDAGDAWCSAFANWCMREVGQRGTGKANARSWLNWGEILEKPIPGCVVVFSRPPSPASGHVAFFVREDGPSWIRVLGGNQRNMVCEAPYARARLLGYRWPAGYPR